VIGCGQKAGPWLGQVRSAPQLAGETVHFKEIVMRKQYLIGGVAAIALAVGVPSFVRAFESGSIKVLADKEDKDEKKDEKEQKIKIEDVPPAVLKAVKEAIPGGKITEAETDMKDGKKIYSFDVQIGGKEYDVDVSEDGKILKTEEDKDEKKDEKK
jgi:uncharacterized membrane protein YkoI